MPKNEDAILVSILQRNKSSRVCVCVCVCVCVWGVVFKGIGSLNYEGWKVQNLQFKFEGHLLAEFSLSGGWSFFVLFRPSTDWMKPTCIMEDNLLYSKSTDLNVNLIQNTFTCLIQNNV